VLDAIAGNMPGDPYSAPPQRRPFIQEVGASPGRLRIGLMKQSPKGGAPLHPDCVAAVEDVAKLLQSLGHLVEESHPSALDEHEHVHHFGVVVNCHTVLALEQLGAAVGKKIGRDDVELWTWTMAERGLSVSASGYLASIHWLQVWSRRIAKWWSDEKFDLLLTPTIAEPPPPLGELVTTREDPTAGWDRLMEVIQFTPP
jgi:amidase